MLEVERVDNNDTIHVHARPRERPCCIRCHFRRIRIEVTYQLPLKHSHLRRNA